MTPESIGCDNDFDVETGLLEVVQLDAVGPGMVFSNYTGWPSNAVVIGDARSQAFDPRQLFKFGRGRLRCINPVELAEQKSLAP